MQEDFGKVCAREKSGWKIMAVTSSPKMFISKKKSNG